MKKILIDTDPGIDDAMAIQMAFAHPALEVVGLTSIFGNVHVEVATRNALRLVELACADCPVATGTDVPLVQPLNPPGYYVHGPAGFGDIPAEEPKGRPDPRDAAHFIVDMVNAHPGELWLCPIGPLTNLALALRLEPGIADKVAGVVVMGGAVERPGNVTPFAEANIWHDPHAAAEVLTAGWPVTLVGLDVTEKCTANAAHFSALAEASPIIGGFLDRAVQFYFDWHKQKEIVPDGCYLHDPTAVLAVAEPGLMEVREVPVRVVTEGEEIGRTIADTSVGTRPVKVCVGVDHLGVRERFLGVTMRADACRAAR